MRHRARRAAIAIVAVGALGAAQQANAAIITGFASASLPGASTGSAGPVGATPAPNNDPEIGPSPNVIPYNIFFNAGGVGPADFEFLVAPSGGTTEYRVTTNIFGLVNNTGTAWTDFHFELGVGTGAAFVPWPVALGALDFDIPDGSPAPTSSVFPVLNHQPQTLDWSGATVYPVGSGMPATVQFTFTIDLPDIAAPRFTLRQYPTVAAVPEPASGLLLVAGLGLAVAVRFRRQQR